MKENQNKVTFLVYGAVIAALYVVLTLPFASFAFGAIQFRVAEALTVLPFFTPAAVPGVTVGCFLANLLGGAPLPDVVFGALATFIGAVLSYRLRRQKWLVCLPPILSNTLIIPWVLRFAYGVPDAIPYLMFTVGLSECIAIGILGNVLLTALIPLRQQLFARCQA
ncbi:MAG: QueT transporter family protein [Lachnospiraceae bacterium]|jgi:uncharacterized membrane protein|nr:QueT transporter family protein [Lachnospiraceae bacterium]